MLERINELMAGLKEVSDNIAHDLKTPLTRLRNRAESALRDARTEEDWRTSTEQIIAESDGMIRIFNALLLIARAESGGARGQLAELDVADVARGVAELYEPLAEERGAELKVEAPVSITVLGNRELIGQVVANLVENALNYATGEGTQGEVTVSAETDGASARISVADRGPGIPPADRTRATERFVRLDFEPVASRIGPWPRARRRGRAASWRRTRAVRQLPRPEGDACFAARGGRDRGSARYAQACSAGAGRSRIGKRPALASQVVSGGTYIPAVRLGIPSAPHKLRGGRGSTGAV